MFIYEYDYRADPFIYEDSYKVSSSITDLIHLVLSPITVLINLIHLMILLKKELRSTSFFILMIGMCASDTLQHVAIFYEKVFEEKRILEFSHWSKHSTCLENGFYLVDPFHGLKKAVLSSTKSITFWISILLVSKSLSSRTSIFLVSLIFSIRFFYYSCHFMFYQKLWYRDNGEASEVLCAPETNATKRWVFPSNLYGFLEARNSMDPLFQVIPIIFVYPNVVICLCQNRPGRLVLITSIFFILTETNATIFNILFIVLKPGMMSNYWKVSKESYLSDHSPSSDIFKTRSRLLSFTSSQSRTPIDKDVDPEVSATRVTELKMQLENMEEL
ncbi:hypothetical protein CRE_19095 [Caenorhabditis remanei]|uniref:G-protein coupled receptors family 1 profile domain-containing protein n=1 Tax=Caenorhabditis remanei TaxID=31234 RepID=E3LJT0_CAERE|nr:hypothetical protein CRE_19095 [Caenorhabditis remanei]